ncbi:MAG: ABC transporter substrate-binding protein [Bacteroidales bacterium]
MHYFKPLLNLLVLILLLNSCKNVAKEEKSALNIHANEYAKFFILSDSSDKFDFQIVDSWSSSYKNVSSYSVDTKSASFRRVVCMSTSHIAYMTALGLEDKIVGVSGKQYITNEVILNRINNGEILDIGYEGSLNYELLLKLKPDVVFTYGILGENNIYINKIKELGINVIALGDYLEDHPLGKLEYLKLFGRLFNCSNKADSIYNSVKGRYISIKNVASRFADRPKVLLNAPWKDVWYIPGRNSYMSVLINDAGGDPVMSKQGESRSVPYSLEEVYQESMNADYWLNPNNYSSIEELKNSNPLFKNIPSLKSGKIYNNTKRETGQGGSDFWEKGVIEPDVILNDLINIIHPELNSAHELVYYKQLK